MQRQEPRVYAMIRNFFYNIYNSIDNVSTTFALLHMLSSVSDQGVALTPEEQQSSKSLMIFLTASLFSYAHIVNRQIDFVSSLEGLWEHIRSGCNSNHATNQKLADNFTDSVVKYGLNYVVVNGFISAFLAQDFIPINIEKNPHSLFALAGGLLGISYFFIDEITTPIMRSITRLCTRGDENVEVIHLGIQHQRNESHIVPRQYADRSLPLRLFDTANAAKTAIFVFQLLNDFQLEVGASWMPKNVVFDYLMLMVINDSLHLARKLTMNPHPISSLVYKKTCEVPSDDETPRAPKYRTPTVGQQIKGAIYAVGPRLGVFFMTVGVLTELRHADMLPEVNLLTGYLLASSYNTLVEGVKMGINICGNPSSLFSNVRQYLCGGNEPVSQQYESLKST